MRRQPEWYRPTTFELRLPVIMTLFSLSIWTSYFVKCALSSQISRGAGLPTLDKHIFFLHFSAPSEAPNCQLSFLQPIKIPRMIHQACWQKWHQLFACTPCQYEHSLHGSRITCNAVLRYAYFHFVILLLLLKLDEMGIFWTLFTDWRKDQVYWNYVINYFMPNPIDFTLLHTVSHIHECDGVTAELSQ